MYFSACRSNVLEKASVKVVYRSTCQLILLSIREKLEMLLLI